MISTNPLRYPGGKYFLTNYINRVLETNSIKNCTFYEPYAGSAAVSLALLSRGAVDNIVIIEKDPLIFSFWKCVIYHTEELIRLIYELDISVKTWNEFKKYRLAKTPLEYSTIELGLAGLFFNRTNYSGILSANPIGGKNQNSKYSINCRFKKREIIRHIKRIAKFKDNISVRWLDAYLFLKENFKVLHQTNSFVYIDPPYYEQGKRLYRYFYEDEDHKNLAELIKKCHFPWLISYDDHPFINDLYFGKGNQIKLQRLYCDYSVRKRKCASELLISNLVIPPVQISNQLLKEIK